MADRAGPAIRRASQAARNAMQQLDASTGAELQALYGAAAEQLRATILAAGFASGTGQIELDQLRALLVAVDAVLDALASQRTAVVQAAIQRAADLGVQPFTAAGLAATGRSVAEVLGTADAVAVSESAASFVRTFRHEDGLVLSDRLWRVDAGAKETLHRAIETAVVQGWSADKAAAELLYRGEPVPAGTRQAQAAAEARAVAGAADVLRDTASSPLASTLRVMRTEINRAHGEAYMVGAERAPGVVGFRFLLSPRHPRPDVCDLLARQNLHGLGPGVYPTRAKTPWPAHPNTLSFVVAVFAEEVTDEHRAGQETSLEALGRLSPELRAGLLGPTKATYFDRGLLRTGTIRSRVRDVTQRLTRQGAL